MSLEHPMARWLAKLLDEIESDYTPLSVPGRNPRLSTEHAWILAEVAAKRRVFTRHAPTSVECPPLWVCSTCRGRPAWPCPEIRDVGSVFTDRAGYRKEWKPVE